MLFLSNYDGSLEAYMDDFINKVGWGLNLVFSNGVGYPRTHWLVQDGSKSEQQFKYTLRRHQLPTEVWYKAYPGLTAFDLARNARIRKGIERKSMTEAEVAPVASGSVRGVRCNSPTSSFSEAEFQDIQGLVRFGHGHLTGARFYLLKIVDAAAARAWLVGRAGDERGDHAAIRCAHCRSRSHTTACRHSAFQKKFCMASPTSSSSAWPAMKAVRAASATYGPNDPSRWRWGRAGAVPHMIVMIYATPERLESRAAEIKRAPWATAFAEFEVAHHGRQRSQRTVRIQGRHQSAGYRLGAQEAGAPARYDRLHQRRRARRVFAGISQRVHAIYRPAAGRRAGRSEAHSAAGRGRAGKRDFGRNGTYLVFRDLAQDVAAFWRYVDQQAQQNADERWKIAHAMVGRTMAGDPIVRTRPETNRRRRNRSEVDLAEPVHLRNDPDGTACPFGAHIRRVNPRNADLPSDARQLVAAHRPGVRLWQPWSAG